MGRNSLASLSFILVVLATVTSVMSQTTWTRHPENPVFNTSSSNPNDIHSLSYAFGPSVLWDQSRGVFFSWFESVAEGAPRFSFSHAMSLDGSRWYYYSRSPVLETGPAPFDSYNLRGPCVIRDAGGYKMYYTAASASTYSIGLATSADGIHWTKYAGNPILVPGAAGTWDDAGLLYCKVLLIGQTYFMWYSGRDGSTSRIGLATSTDGVAWTKHNANPVLGVGNPGQWDAYYVEDPAVASVNGILYMVYTARPNLSTQQIGLATSLDGVSWQKYASNPILTGQAGWEGSNVAVASLLLKDNTFHLWYSADGSGTWKAGFATAPLEYPPNPHPNVVLNPGFEAGTAPWTFYTNGAATLSVVTPGNQSSKAARISISTAGTNVQLAQTGLPLDPNSAYQLSFDAYSTTGHDIALYLHRNTSPYTNYGVNNFVANLTLGWQHYTLVFTTTGFASQTTDTRLRFWLAPYDAPGDQYYLDNVSITKLADGRIVADARQESRGIPEKAYLGQNYPNPFNPETVIEFGLTEPGTVTLEVFNTLGQRVRTLVNAELGAGTHSARFDGTDLPSGTYFYRLTNSAQGSQMPLLQGKMLLVK
jgi:predicted GH43/DUF377 family glycosyl hydrolase